MIPAGSRKPTPKPTATWLRVTRAKARNPQKTKAWARPGRGRSRMTLAWQRTSQKKSQMRLPSGERLKEGSLRESRIRLRIGPKRRQNKAIELRMMTAKVSFSPSEKPCGSARVEERKFISEPPHDTRSGAWSARGHNAGNEGVTNTKQGAGSNEQEAGIMIGVCV